MTDAEILRIATRLSMLTVACKDSLWANTLIAFAMAVLAAQKEERND